MVEVAMSLASALVIPLPMFVTEEMSFEKIKKAWLPSAAAIGVAS